MKHLEAITICVNFSDYLLRCIDNRKHFNKWTIITHPTDQDTINLCSKYHLNCELSERFYENKAQFNKGKGINDGLIGIEKNGWLLHLDADILLPSNFRQFFEMAHLNKQYLYGAYNRILKNHYETSCSHRSKKKHLKYLLKGFFQLWNLEEYPNVKYPEYCKTAGTSDLDFNFNFPKTEVLPITVKHFGPVCTFHKGRKKKNENGGDWI